MGVLPLRIEGMGNMGISRQFTMYTKVGGSVGRNTLGITTGNIITGLPGAGNTSGYYQVLPGITRYYEVLPGITRPCTLRCQHFTKLGAHPLRFVGMP